MTETDYEALAARLSDPDAPLPKSAGRVKTGAAAAESGRAFLLREYGSKEALDAELRKAGRPRLGEQTRGASPSVRGRLPEAEHAAFTRLQETSGRSQSDLIREAVHDLLVKHQAAS